MNKLFIFLSTSFLTALCLFADNIAVVDTGKALQEYNDYADAVEKVNASLLPMEEEIMRMQEEVNNIIAEAREADAMANNLSVDQSVRDEAASTVIEMQAQLQKLQVEIGTLSNEYQKAREDGANQSLIPLQEKFVEIIVSISEEEGYDLTIPKGSVIYSNESLDITDKVISELNK